MEVQDDDIAMVTRTRTTLAGEHTRPGSDRLVREEPLEIRVFDKPLAVLMRTPGDDRDLVRGFLRTEGIIQTPDEIASIRPCTNLSTPEAEDNVMLVRLASDVAFDDERHRRLLISVSSCGMCGKATLEAALAEAPPLDTHLSLSRRSIAEMMAEMVHHQPLFAATGGLHAAALFASDGRLQLVREDIGRHNAVDKVLGATFDTGRSVLSVSGRVSYEIVQKALRARVPVVVAVSAPSSLAVDLARRAGMTLIAFARGDRMAVYAGENRVS